MTTAQQALVTVSLASIDIECYVNYRSTFDIAAVVSLREGIRKSGMITPVLLAVHPTEKDKYAMVAGYTRYEVQTQLALEEIVREFNTENELKVGDENFISLESVEDRQRMYDFDPKWAKKVDDALGAHEINAQVDENVKNKHDAALKNVEENELRTDVSLLDKMNRIAEMLSAKNDKGKAVFKAQEIATALGKKPAYVSQVKKIDSFLTGWEQHLKSLYDEANGKVMDTEVYAEYKEKWKAAIDEITHRIQLISEDELAIGLMLLRGAVYAIDNKPEKRLDLDRSTELLKYLACLNDDYKPTKATPVDNKVFKRQLEDLLKQQNTANEPVAETPAEEEVSDVDAVADAQDELKSEEAEGEGEGEGEAEAEAEGEGEAEAEAEDISLDEEDLGVDEEFTEEGSEEGDVPPTENDDDDDGASRVKATDAPPEVYKIKKAEQLDAIARSRFEEAVQPRMSLENESSGPSLVDRVTHVAEAVEIYSAIGLTESSSQMNDILVSSSENLSEYICWMREQLLKKGSAETKERLFSYEDAFYNSLGVSDIADE